MPAGRLARLGATLDFHHGLFSQTPSGPAHSGIIRGRVVAIGFETAAPIQGARVLVASEPGAIDPVFTDGSGRFEITGLAGGHYTLTAEKTGFARTRYGSKNDLDPALPLDVSDTGVVDGVEIGMPKGSAILGRIVDDLGDPVADASVSVGFTRVAGSEARFVPIARPAAATNDRGEYRIGGLAAGRYYVSVAAAAASGGPSFFARPIGWERMFYRTASSVAGANAIVLGAGEERDGVDFTLVPVQPAKLRLTLTDASGAPATGMINLMLPAEPGGPLVANRGIPFQQSVQTLQPGEWIAAGLIGNSWVALSHVTLRSGEETALIVAPGRPSRISGRVVFEGATAAPALTGIRVDVRGAGADASVSSRQLASNGPAALKPDGTFEITPVLGTISVQVVAPPRGWMLKAVRYSDRDLIDEPIALNGGDDISGVQVVLTDWLAALAGTAVDADGRPAAGCPVALFPEKGAPGFGSRWTRLLRADQKGRFDMSELLPGSYLAAAVSDIDAAAWLTPDYLDRLRPAAARVTLTGREKQTITLACASAP